MNKKVYKIRKVGEETHKAAFEYYLIDDGITPIGGFSHYGIFHGDYIMIKGYCMGPKNKVIMLFLCVCLCTLCYFV